MIGAVAGAAAGAAVGFGGRRRMRSRKAHIVTRVIASPMMCHDIFDSPRMRSMKVMGTSTMVAPRLCDRYASSTWKP